MKNEKKVFYFGQRGNEQIRSFTPPLMKSGSCHLNKQVSGRIQKYPGEAARERKIGLYKRRTALQTGGDFVNEFPLSQPGERLRTLYKCRAGGGVSGNRLP